MPKYYSRPALMDPDNSESVFERGRFNEWGEPYCIEAALSIPQARALVERLNRGES